MKKVFLSLLALLIVLSSLMLVPVTASTAEKNVLEIVLNVPGFDPSFFRWALTGQNNGYIKMNDQDIASITTVSEDGKTATIRYMSDEPIEFGTYKIDVFGFMIYLHSFNIEINAESGSASVTSDAGEPGTVSWTISKVTVEEEPAGDNVLEIVLNVPGFDPNFFRWALTGQNNGYIKMNDQDVASITTVSEDGKTATIRYTSNEPIEFGTYKIDVFGFMIYLHSFNIEINAESGSASVTSDAGEPGTVTWNITNAPVVEEPADENVLEIVLNVPGFDPYFFRWALTGENKGYIKMNDQDVAAITTVSEDGKTATIRYTSDEPIEFGTYKVDVFGFNIYLHSFNIEINAESGSASVTSDAGEPGTVTWNITNAPVVEEPADENVLEIVLNVPGFDPYFFRWALTGENKGYIKMNDQDVAAITTVSEDGKTATIRYTSDEPIEFGTYKVDVFGFNIYLHSFNIEINAESGSASVTSDAGEPGTVTWNITNAPVVEEPADENVLEIVLNVPGFDPYFFRWALTGENKGYIKMNDQDVAAITTVSEDGKTATIRYTSDEPIEFGTYKVDVFGFNIYLHSFDIEINAESGSASVTSSANEPGTVTWTITGDYVEGEKPCQHTETEVKDAVEATCGKDGYTGDTYCKACGTKTATGTTIVATGNHAETEVRDAVEATCGKDGYTGDTYCKACGTKTATGTAIAAGHGETEVRDASEATCGKDGYTGDTYCKVCGEKTATGTTIAATGNHAETEVRDAVEATCGKDGYSGDTYCKACGTKTATGTAIAATGNHADDNNDGYCDGCDKELEKPDSPDTGDVAISVVAVALVAGVALISFKKKAAKF